MPRYDRLLPAGLLALALAATPALGDNEGRGRDKSGTFSFALIADVPYNPEQVGKFDTLIDDVNAARGIEFVLHAGDIKGGSTPCDDATFQARFDQYQGFRKPFIYTPGDNEWTDCHRAGAGQFNPLERLERLREIFYPVPGRTTGGRDRKLRTQAEEAGFETYVENTLWSEGGVTFAAIHVVGSNNNLAPWSGIDPSDSFGAPRPDRLVEFEARQAASLAWLNEAFDVAEEENSPGLFLMIHANPRFDVDAAEDARAGFNAFLDLLAERTIEFDRPVVLAHGDFHFLSIDKPLFAPTAGGANRRIADFTRIQTFGTDDVHWVRVDVDPDSRDVFTLRQMIVEDNQFAR